MIIQPATSQGSPFIASGQASYISSGQYRLAHTGEPPKLGDAIKVWFSADFTAGDSLALGAAAYLPIKNISGETVSRIAAGNTITLTYAGNSWVAQFFSSLKGRPTYEYFKQGEETQPSASAYWYTSTNSNRYVFASTASTYALWANILLEPVTPGERMVVKVNITGGSGNTSGRTSGGTYANHRLEIQRGTNFWHRYKATSSNEMEGNSSSRPKSHRCVSSFMEVFDNVQSDEVISFAISGHGSDWNYTTGIYVINSYNIAVEHYPA